MSARDDLKEMARGFRWGRRPMVPRSAEPYTEEREDAGFPTDWARTEAGVAARQAILQGIMHPLVRNELSLRVYGLDHLRAVRGPVVFFSNHSSHLDATLILCTLPDRWQRRTAVGAARDYFFDVWWRQAFTALVYAGFPIDRSRGGKGIDKARELVRDGWSKVVFPEGSRTPDGHMQRFRHGASRPGKGRPVVTIRYGDPIHPQEGETHQSLSLRMQQAVAQLFDEDRTTWFDAISRAERSETPSLAGPIAPAWRRTWEGSRPVARRGRPRAWE